MYVCVCNAYRDTEIRAVAQAGVRCAKKAYQELGNGPQCGRCLSFAQGLIDGVHEDRPRGGPLPTDQRKAVREGARP